MLRGAGPSNRSSTLSSSAAPPHGCFAVLGPQAVRRRSRRQPPHLTGALRYWALQPFVDVLVVSRPTSRVPCGAGPSSRSSTLVLMHSLAVTLYFCEVPHGLNQSIVPRMCGIPGGLSSSLSLLARDHACSASCCRGYKSQILVFAGKRRTHGVTVAVWSAPSGRSIWLLLSRAYVVLTAHTHAAASLAA